MKSDGEYGGAARALLERYTVEMIDREGLESTLETMRRENGWTHDDPRLALTRDRLTGSTGFAVAGTAAEIAEQLGHIADSGIDGVLMTWIDYVDGVRRFGEEVLPLLEAAGLRAPFGGP